MFDAHCHLTDIDDPIAALDHAVSEGVRSLLTCGFNTESNEAVLKLHERLPNLPFAVGLHPWFADQDLEPVLALIEEKRPTAIGEVGLDLWGEKPVHPRDRQIEVLEAQLDLATKLQLPVTIHSRKAVDVLLSVVRNHPAVRGALHAYSGSYEQARPFLDLGFYIGVGGAVTRSRAKRVRRCAERIPLDRIVLETDAPAIGMTGVEPPDVRPHHLPKVCAALGELRNMDPREVSERTDGNVARLLGEQVSKDPLKGRKDGTTVASRDLNE